MQKIIPEIPKKSWLYYFIKRTFDIFFSIFLLLFLSPLFLIVSLIIIITSGFPIIYVSERIGKDGVPFKFFKFRTMVKNADKMLDDVKKLNETNGPTFKAKNDPRLTKFGRFLRKTSIDELPQLVNILFGQMTFVGPRPPIRSEVEQYSEFDELRLTARPGLTCIWQCSGRNEIGFEQWMEMDVEYLQKRSIWFDFYLLLKTVVAVITQKGAY